MSPVEWVLPNLWVKFQCQNLPGVFAEVHIKHLSFNTSPSPILLLWNLFLFSLAFHPLLIKYEFFLLYRDLGFCLFVYLLFVWFSYWWEAAEIFFKCNWNWLVLLGGFVLFWPLTFGWLLWVVFLQFPPPCGRCLFSWCSSGPASLKLLTRASWGRPAFTAALRMKTKGFRKMSEASSPAADFVSESYKWAVGIRSV